MNVYERKFKDNKPLEFTFWEEVEINLDFFWFLIKKVLKRG